MTTSLRKLTPEEARDEQIIQDMIKGTDVSLVAHIYGVTLEHIQDLFRPPRFTSSNQTVKMIELARLDAATRVLMPMVDLGDLDAIDSLLKVQARRSKYLGLDVPVQTQGQQHVVVELKHTRPDFGKTWGARAADIVEQASPDERVPVVYEPWREQAPEPVPFIRAEDVLGPGPGVANPSHPGAKPKRAG